MGGGVSGTISVSNLPPPPHGPPLSIYDHPLGTGHYLGLGGRGKLHFMGKFFKALSACEQNIE